MQEPCLSPEIKSVPQDDLQTFGFSFISENFPSSKLLCDSHEYWHKIQNIKPQKVNCWTNEWTFMEFSRSADTAGN